MRFAPLVPQASHARGELTLETLCLSVWGCGFDLRDSRVHCRALSGGIVYFPEVLAQDNRDLVTYLTETLDSWEVIILNIFRG